MRIKLVRIMIDGEVGYLKTPTPSACTLISEQLVSSPLNALNFAGQDGALSSALNSLVAPGDMVYAKSGLRVDKLPEVVIFNVSITEEYCSSVSSLLEFK